jgi:hypothetical protein
VNYNKRLHQRFYQRRLRNNEEDFDPIHVEELNFNSEWMTGVEGAANEFVYGDDGLTWAQVDMVVGVSDYMSGSRDTRLKRRKISQSKGKGKAPIVEEEEEEWEDNEASDEEDVAFGSKFYESDEDSR